MAPRGKLVACFALRALSDKYRSRENLGPKFIVHICIYLIDIYTRNEYNIVMIKTFADKETEKVYNQHFSKKLPNAIQKVALCKLIMIDNAESLEDLRVPPANHLELLHGDREGQYSIRINEQYRICFTLSGRDVVDVEIVDYH